MINIKKLDLVSLAIYISIAIIVYTICIITLILLDYLYDIYFFGLVMAIPSAIQYKIANINNPFSAIRIFLKIFIRVNKFALYFILLIFGACLMFLIVLYSIYKFCVATVILIPFTKSPPLKYMKSLGVIKLFDNINKIIFKNTNPLAKFFNTYLATLDFTQNFLGLSDLDLSDMDMGNIEEPFLNQKMSEIRESFTIIKNNIIDLKNNEKNNEKNNKKNNEKNNIKNNEKIKCPIGKILNVKTNTCIKNTNAEEMNENIIEKFQNKNIIENFEIENIIEGFSNDDDIYSYLSSFENIYNIFSDSISNTSNSISSQIDVEEKKKEDSSNDFEKVKNDLEKCISDLEACNK